jgi:hypothetical protein
VTKEEQKKTAIATDAYSAQARLRRTGMFIDLAAFILSWRSENEGRRYPPEPEMRDYLRSRGWTAPKGGAVSIGTIQNMMQSMTSGEDIFPHAALDRIAVGDAIALPGTEIATVAIDPEAWAHFCDEIRDGWQPSWRERSTTEEDEESLLARMNDLLSR